MNELILYRKRIIPSECILLKHDIVLSRDSHQLVTSWDALHSCHEHNHGLSCYYFDQGIKVSLFLRPDNSIVCTYIDIVSYDFKDEFTLTVTDLLADVIITPEGSVQVVDLDELSDAHSQRLISDKQLHYSLKTLNTLLTQIYNDGTKNLVSPLIPYIK